MATWVTLKALHEQTGFAVRTLQYIAAQEPGVLITRVKGSKTEYKQPDCAINLRKRDVEAAVAKTKAEKQPTASQMAAEREAIADAKIKEAKAAQISREWLPRDDVRIELRNFAHEMRGVLEAAPGKHAYRMVALPDLNAATIALRGVMQAVLATLYKLPLGAGRDEQPKADAA